MKRLFLAALLLIPVSASALNTNELLSLVALPLAVAAVADVTGVPTDELSNFIATLNNANVPAPQMIEVIRYVPVALVMDATQQQPVFVEYVQSQVQQGVTGLALMPIIVERLRTYDVQPEFITITAPQTPVQVRTIIVDRTYIPPVVITRVEEIRKRHPHGGPPGQLKKAIGVQTGAEVVHGGKRGQPEKQQKGVAPPMISSAPQAIPPGQAKKDHGMPPGQAKKMEGGKGHGDKGHEKH